MPFSLSVSTLGLLRKNLTSFVNIDCFDGVSDNFLGPEEASADEDEDAAGFSAAINTELSGTCSFCNT